VEHINTKKTNARSQQSCPLTKSNNQRK